MIIGIAGLYPIFGFLVTVLERRAFTGQSDTSTTKDHDWSIDFDENDSCDVVTESDLLARHEVNEKVIDPGDMASRVRNLFSGISTQKKNTAWSPLPVPFACWCAEHVYWSSTRRWIQAENAGGPATISNAEVICDRSVFHSNASNDASRSVHMRSTTLSLHFRQGEVRPR